VSTDHIEVVIDLARKVAAWAKKRGPWDHEAGVLGPWTAAEARQTQGWGKIKLALLSPDQVRDSRPADA
jgi:hypothetical protein